jgi:WD domain, G-beta repeat/WD40-like Beta Propeller Repeat
MMQLRTMLTVVAAAGLTVLLTSCSGTSIGAGVGYQPDGLPVKFSAEFTIHPDGSISVAATAGIVTEIGVFSVDVNFEANAHPTESETLLIIRHKAGRGLVDSVYRIGTGRAVVVTVDGHTVITVTNHKVLIDASKGRVRSIVIKNAPVLRVTPHHSPASGNVRLVRVLRVPNVSISTLAWSPNSRLIAVAGTGAGESITPEVSKIIRVGNGAVVAGHKEQDNYIARISWSPNGRYIATVNSESVPIWDPKTGRTVVVIPAVLNGDKEASWSPNSRFLVISAGGSFPQVWSVASSSEVGSLPGYANFGADAEWSPKSHYIISVDTVWNSSTDRKIRSYSGGGGVDSFGISEWSPNGQYIASTDNYSLVVWDSRTGAAQWVKSIGNASSPAISWSPDGKYIAWTDGNLASILDASTGHLIEYIGGGPSNTFFTNTVDAIAWSPNGAYIATATNGRIQIWQSPNGR